MKHSFSFISGAFVAPFLLPTVEQLHQLHEQVRGLTGPNLRKKSINDIHQLVANEELLITENSLGPTGMISVRATKAAESPRVLIYFNPMSQQPCFNTAKTGEINSFAVHPSMTGQGIGQTLVKAALTHAKDIGLHHVFARVAKGNDRARFLFEKSGFVHRTDTHRIEDGTPLWVLTRTL